LWGNADDPKFTDPAAYNRAVSPSPGRQVRRATPLAKEQGRAANDDLVENDDDTSSPQEQGRWRKRPRTAERTQLVERVEDDERNEPHGGRFAPARPPQSMPAGTSSSAIAISPAARGVSSSARVASSTTAALLTSSSATPNPASIANSADMVPWQPSTKGWADVTVTEVYRTSVPRKAPKRPASVPKTGYYVEWIGAKGVNRAGKTVWNVKWCGWTYSSNTWEPTENLPSHFLQGLSPVAGSCQQMGRRSGGGRGG